MLVQSFLKNGMIWVQLGPSEVALWEMSWARWQEMLQRALLSTGAHALCLTNLEGLPSLTLSRTQENRTCKVSTFLKIRKGTMVWLTVQV